MLVITRTTDQALVIGDLIEIRVVRVGRRSVRLGVTAPPQVAVYRSEIYNQIRAANEHAAASRADTSALTDRLRALTSKRKPKERVRP